MMNKLWKITKVTLTTVGAIFLALVALMAYDISNDPKEVATKQETKQVIPTEVKVAGTQSIDYKRATLRQILSQQYPLVSAMEVTWKHGNSGTYDLKNVDPKVDEHDTFTLEGDYQVGDIVVVVWGGDSGEDIVGSVKLADASELDIQWNKGGSN